MEQSKIWQFFQTEQPESFYGAATRLNFLARRLPQTGLSINIGVGSGQFERFAAGLGRRVISLDPDVSSLQTAHGGQDMPSVCGRIQALPFADASVDMVVASEVLEHLDDETLTAGLSEILRILRPGGRFLGTVPFEEDLLASQAVCPHCGTVFHRVGHVRSYGFSSMREQLASRFETVKLRRKAFMHTSDLGLRKRMIGRVRNFLVQSGLLTRETSLVFEATKSA